MRRLMIVATGLGGTAAIRTTFALWACRGVLGPLAVVAVLMIALFGMTGDFDSTKPATHTAPSTVWNYETSHPEASPPHSRSVHIQLTVKTSKLP